jgi:hypothetical protein
MKQESAGRQVASLHASDFYISLSSEIIIGFWNDNNVLYTSSAVDYELQSHSGQTKDYKIGICCFFYR